MTKPNFDIIEDLAIRSFLDYVWKRIEREHRAIDKMIESKEPYNTDLLVERMEKYNRWIDGLEIYVAALAGIIPEAFSDLKKDFREHNSNPSGSDGPFFRRIPVSA